MEVLVWCPIVAAGVRWGSLSLRRVPMAPCRNVTFNKGKRDEKVVRFCKKKRTSKRKPSPFNLCVDTAARSWFTRRLRVA